VRERHRAARFIAPGTYVSRMIIFKCSEQPTFSRWTISGSVVGKSYSGLISKVLLVDLLKRFLKFKTEGEVLLIFYNHGNYICYETIRFCEDHDRELMGGPPHSTHVLQPLGRTIF
jgi:hypothetical protein